MVKNRKKGKINSVEAVLPIHFSEHNPPRCEKWVNSGELTLSIFEYCLSEFYPYNLSQRKFFGITVLLLFCILGREK